MDEERLRQIKGGWAALGTGWAVFGATREEALERFREAEIRHEEISRRVAEPLAGEGGDQ